MEQNIMHSITGNGLLGREGKKKEDEYVVASLLVQIIRIYSH